MAVDPSIQPRADRLSLLLGPATGLLKPSGALLLGFSLWLLLGLCTGRWLALALSCWSLVLLLLAMGIERRWLAVLPLPPLTVMAFAGFMRWGLGGFFLVAAGSHVRPDVKPWVVGLEPAQALGAVLYTSILAVALLNRSWMRHFPPKPLGEDLRARLPWLTLLLGLFSLAYLGIGVGFGTLDCGWTNYVHWTTQLWRPDTLFIPFLRFKDLFYLLVPVAVVSAKRPGSLGRGWLPAVLIAITLLSLLLAAGNGGRGLLLAPLVLILLGFWFTDLSVQSIRRLALAVLLFALMFIPVMDALRETSVFKATSSQHPLERVQVISQGMRAASFKPETLSLIGRDLFGASDPYLFQPPGSLLSPVGNKRLQGLLFLWVPKHLYPQRPEINDGHLIAKEIMGKPGKGIVNGQHIWFPNITFAADLYCRYRWAGVFLGCALFGLFYALLCRLWYRSASLSGGLFALLLALYPATFFNGLPLRSLSETVWNWSWDFPKYLIAMLVLSWLGECLYRWVVKSSPASTAS